MKNVLCKRVATSKIEGDLFEIFVGMVSRCNGPGIV